MNAGNCLLEMGKPKEALSHFYHADYIKPDKPSTLKAIAWGELQAGDHQKSKEYYKKITNLPEATQSDFINAGHAHYLSGDMKKGVEHYVKSIGRPGGSVEGFEKEMLSDMEMLQKNGKTESEIRMIIDKVKYEKEGLSV